MSSLAIKIRFILFFSMIFCFSSYSEESIELSIKDKFTHSLKNWETYLEKTNPSFLSVESVYTEDLQDIVNLGIQSLPLIFEVMNSKTENPYRGHIFFFLMQKITKKVLPTEGLTIDEIYDCTKITDRWIKWWTEDRSETKSLFQDYYIKFISRDNIDKSNCLQLIRNLGLPALPFAIEKIEEGDVDLIEAVNYWTDDALKKSAEEKMIPAESMREYCIQWWKENKDNWILPTLEEKKQE